MRIASAERAVNGEEHPPHERYVTRGGCRAPRPPAQPENSGPTETQRGCLRLSCGAEQLCKRSIATGLVHGV
jgi:hypothetical protein